MYHPRTGNRETAASKLAAVGSCEHIGAESVDGTDVIAVYEAVGRAAARARSGEGAQMVELRYFRRLGHAQHDPHDYIDPALTAEWEARDPIDLFHACILDRGWASDDELRAIRQEVEQQCRVAAERALDEPVPQGPEAVDDIYTDVLMPHPWTRAENPDPRNA